MIKTVEELDKALEEYFDYNILPIPVGFGKYISVNALCGLTGRNTWSECEFKTADVGTIVFNIPDTYNYTDIYNHMILLYERFAKNKDKMERNRKKR